MSGYQEGILVILCLNIIFAYAVYWPLAVGQLNLGIAGFIGVGAYTAAYLSNEYQMAPFLACLVAAFVSMAVALVIAVPILRSKGIYLALATFAFGQVLQSILLNLEFVGGAAGYPVFEYIGLGTIFYSAIAVIVITILLNRTRFGLNIVAVHDDEAVSDLFGLNVRAYQTIAFALGAAFAGFGGGLYGHQFNYIEPQNYDVLFSISIVLFVLLGGTQTVLGPLLGAIFFTLLPEILRGSEEWRFAIFAMMIIATMVLRPEGLITTRQLRTLSGLFSRARVGSSKHAG